MRYTEFNSTEPQVGDIVGIELGDTLIETVIQEIRPDGIVVSFDEAAIQLIESANKSRRINESISEADFPSATGTSDSEYKVDTKLAARLSKNTEPGMDSAINWIMKLFKQIPSEIRNELTNIGNEELVDYLRHQATQSDAFNKFNFEIEDIADSQSLLPEIYQNTLINTWADVLAEFKDRVINLDEAEYQGRKVALGKPMQGDVKKSKVYVKGPKGNVVKVNFGDPNMKIKKSNPARRKSFRARHNCDNPGPRWKARYWSCRAW